jgi:hypothetical protein
MVLVVEGEGEGEGEGGEGGGGDEKKLDVTPVFRPWTENWIAEYHGLSDMEFLPGWNYAHSYTYAANFPTLST